MKNLLIFGAGQMGQAVLPLINQKHYHLIGFGDNAKKEQTMIKNIPLYTMEEALLLPIDVILVAVTGIERQTEIIKQLHHNGYNKEIIEITKLIEAIDIRSAFTIKLKDRLKDIEGAVAELGVFQGEFSKVLNAVFPRRKLYLFDTFNGFDERDIQMENETGLSKAYKEEFQNTSIQMVLDKLSNPSQVIIKEGYFPDTTIGIQETFALVSIDVDLYTPTYEGLKWFIKRMNKGAIILLHDYGNQRFQGVKKAVEDYEKEYGSLVLVELCDLHGTAIIIKQ